MGGWAGQRSKRRAEQRGQGAAAGSLQHEGGEVGSRIRDVETGRVPAPTKGEGPHVLH